MSPVRLLQHTESAPLLLDSYSRLAVRQLSEQSIILTSGFFMKKVIASLAVTIACATSASAADLAARPYTKAPLVAPVVMDSWAGVYIGGQAGYSWSRSSYTADNGAGTIENFAFEPNSFIGGGHIGAQGQWGSWVLGAEGTYNWVDLDQTDPSLLLPGRRRELKTDGIATIVGKVGYSFGTWMLYAKAGWADARIKTYAVNPASGVFGTATNWQSGWTVGGGVDYKFSPNWIAGVDFNYYNFKFDRSALNSDGVTVGRWFNTNSDIYAVTFRLSYLFNFGAPLVAKY